MRENHNICEEICIRLIKSELWGTEIVIPPSFNQWDKVARIAKKQSVLALVGNAMLAQPAISDDLSLELKTKIKSFIVSNMYMHQQLNHLLLKAKAALEGKKIVPVLLKGQGVASNYPNPLLRQCGDVDFYIGEERYEDAYEVFKEIASKIDDKSDIYKGKHFHAFIGKIEFDVHRFCGKYSLKSYDRRFQEESLKGLTKDFEELDVQNVVVYAPAREYNAYYIFNHILNHFQVSGIGLRHLCDLMMFLHANYGKLDLNELKRILDRMGVMYPWKLFGGVLVNVLGMPAYEFPFYENISRWKIDNVVRHILDEGNFGFGTNYYSYVSTQGLSRYYHSIKFHTVRFLRLFTIMPKASLRRMCNYLAFGFSCIWNR